MLPTLNFSSPLILASLAGLPFLWYFLKVAPNNTKTIHFPGYFFLKQIENREETPNHLPIWLLLLRLFVITCIIAGLAGPVLNKATSNGQTTPLLILLDDGFSSAAQWHTRQKTLQTIAAEANQDNREIYLIRTAPVGHDAAATLHGPMTGKQLHTLAPTITPSALLPDRSALLPSLEALHARITNADVRWLSDGLTSQPATIAPLLRLLRTFGAVTLYRPTDQHLLLINQLTNESDKSFAHVSLIPPSPTTIDGRINLIARDGRLLGSSPFTILPKQENINVRVELPLMLRNALSHLQIVDQSHAGATFLADARNRWAAIGIPSYTQFNDTSLLNPDHYIRQALVPYALVQHAPLENLITDTVDMIILNDQGRLAQPTIDALSGWVAQGGMLVQFAGPKLADAASDPQTAHHLQALLPAPLRMGDRSFGGALTWDTPQKIDGFAPQSPFADIIVDQDVTITRQVLIRPDALQDVANWAYLSDGTPLVTARAHGQGMFVMFHVTATPAWSDLPISGNFVDMLKKLSLLAASDTPRATPATRFQPLRILNGFGQFETPSDAVHAVTPADIASGPTPRHPPGLYGPPESPLAINASPVVQHLVTLERTMPLSGITQKSYTRSVPNDLSGPFFLVALLFFLLDLVISTWRKAHNSLPHLAPLLGRAAKALGGMVGFKFSVFFLVGTVYSGLQPGNAEPIARTTLSPKAVAAALETRLAYVETGNAAVDSISFAGLRSLTLALTQRTALAPASPVAVDLMVDDLSVYPFIYWPITPATPLPTPSALAAIETFMASGGLLVIDTMDGERADISKKSLQAIRLQNILVRMNIPPLAPVPEGHVLGRSFYLLDALPGRNTGGRVWVEAKASLGENNDGVTPLIISGRDWAAAWATDSQGLPLRPMRATQRPQREYAIRAGVNMVMVALTGNYKVDQLQATALLDRLGKE